MKVDKFSPKLVLKEARCAGIDTVVNRMIYIAEEKGILMISKYQLRVYWKVFIRGSSGDSEWYSRGDSGGEEVRIDIWFTMSFDTT